MALTLKDLETVLLPISKVGKGEEKFDVNGLSITLRALAPDEELSVQRYARVALVDGGGPSDQISLLEYLDRFRTCLFGYALVQIGSMDLRNVEFVETGEKLENGTPIKVRKHEAIMKIVETWGRPLIEAVYAKFASLRERVEEEVSKTIEFEEVDYDAEIARLEERINDLKEKKIQSDLKKSDVRSRAHEAAENPQLITQTVEDDSEEGGEEIPNESLTMKDMVSGESEYVALPSDMSKTVVESGEEDEAEEGDEPPVRPAPQPRKPLFGTPSAPVRASQPVPTVPSTPAGSVESSFVDTSDPNVIEAENQRLMALRNKPQAQDGIVVRPPHLSAKAAFEEARAAVKTGVQDGLEVYQFPVQSLTKELATPPAPKPAPKSNVNPRFQPAGRPRPIK